LQYPLLWKLIQQAMIDQGRTDYYHGANVFVYYSVPGVEQQLTGHG
jgi:hypothetical protein